MGNRGNRIGHELIIVEATIIGNRCKRFIIPFFSTFVHF